MNWDQYFMSVARVVGSNSKCTSRKVGAILVKNKHIISTGYNGPPSSTKHPDQWRVEDFGEYLKKDHVPLIIDRRLSCPRQAYGFKSGEAIYLCPCNHSERNTIVLAARYGISTEGSTLYCDCGIPCLDCVKELINAGIIEIVCTGIEELNTNNEYNLKLAYKLLQEVGIKIRTYKEEE